MEMKKELLEKEKACELEDNALNDVSGGSLPIFDKKTVNVDASVEVRFPLNKGE